MAEQLAYDRDAGREAKYAEIIPQIESLIDPDAGPIANLANISAVLKEVFGFHWVGSYLARGDELILGPFQGPLACTRIRIGEGVCGHAYSTGEITVVPDVDKFPGHIVCSSASRSEIVVPIVSSSGETIGVLDVDSDKLDDFSQVDSDALGHIARIIGRTI